MVFNEKQTKLPIKKTPNFVIVMFVVHILDLFFTQIQFSRATVPQMEQTIRSSESFIYGTMCLARV